MLLALMRPHVRLPFAKTPKMLRGRSRTLYFPSEPGRVFVDLNTCFVTKPAYFPVALVMVCQ